MTLCTGLTDFFTLVVVPWDRCVHNPHVLHHRSYSRLQCDGVDKAAAAVASHCLVGSGLLLLLGCHGCVPERFAGPRGNFCRVRSFGILGVVNNVLEHWTLLHMV